MTPKQAEKFKSRKMKDKWWMMNDEWWRFQAVGVFDLWQTNGRTDICVNVIVRGLLLSDFSRLYPVSFKIY